MNYYDRITSLLLGEAKAKPEAVERAKKHHAARRAAKGKSINAGDGLPAPRAENNDDTMSDQEKSSYAARMIDRPLPRSTK